MKKCIICLLVFSMLLALVACGDSKTAKNPETDQVVGSVEGEPIYFWEYNFFLQDVKQVMLEQYGIEPSDISASKEFWKRDFDGQTASELAIEKAFDEVTSFKRQVIFAKQNGATVDESYEQQLDKQIGEYKEAVGAEYFEVFLIEMGLTSEEQYRQISRDNAHINNFYQSLTADGTVTVSDEEIEAFYNEYIAPTYDVVTAKHILISTVDENGAPLSDEKIAKAEALAKDLHKQITDGEIEFDAAMQEYGQDPGVKSNPDGYTFGRGEMVEAFETTAFGLEIGEMSEPVLSEFGWHIILLTDAKTQTLEEASDNIRQQLSFSACTKYIMEHTESFAIEKNEDVLAKVQI